MSAVTLTPRQREVVLQAIERCLPGVTVWVYGSRVRGTARPTSDLDMVVFAPPERRPEVFALREAFEDSSLPVRVDLFLWDEIPEEFRKNIEAEHAVLSDPRASRPPG